MLSSVSRDNELLQAVRNEDIAALSRILTKIKTPKKLLSTAKKVSINAQDCDGISGLHQAALQCSVPVMQLLLDHGAAVDLKDARGMRPLHYASWQGKPDPVSLLLQYNASVNEAANTGDTPLHLAAQHGHVQVIRQLIYYHANPTLRNKEHKTPLDLACEFGRKTVVELLLGSPRCRQLLAESSQDLLDNGRTTCLHLAARNGHTDVIRCLLDGGVDINRATLRGTALHEAAMHGKLEAVRLLIQSGIDVNKPNSSEQTALDLVRSFSSSKAARDLKRLLKEMLQAVPARAIREHHDPSDPECLTLREGDTVTVLDQSTDGRWKGIVFGPGHSSRGGYFPATAVQLLDRPVGGLQRNGTLRSSTIKKVPPPVVPDLAAGLNPRHSSSSSGSSSTSSSCSSGSSGYSSQTDRLPSLSCGGGGVGVGGGLSDDTRDPPGSPGLDYMDRNAAFCEGDTFPDTQVAPLSRPRSHPGTPVGTPTTPLPPGLPTGRGCYVPIGGGSLDDASGVTGGGTSLGRDSPSGGSVESRHSSSSLDSGRGSSSSSSADSKVAHRLSSGSHGSSSSLTLTSSVSSQMSSLTPDVVVLSPVNVATLLLHRVPDTEVLTTWLKNLHFEEYVHLFLQAGYDMPTISRMTPEDLTAIGITKPAHRRKLKAEISKLNISDGIPDYKPDNLLVWLRLLRLEQYYGSLCQQGYTTVDRVSDLTWEDLEDIGIQKLGHQKKMMLAIKKIRDLNSGAPRHSSIYAEARHASVDMGQLLTPRPGSHVRVGHPSPYHGHGMHPAVAAEAQDVAIATSRAASFASRDTGRNGGEPEALQLRTFRQPSPPRTAAPVSSSSSGGFYHPSSGGDAFLAHHPQFPPPPPQPQHYQHEQGADWYRHDFVSMQVRSPNRGRSLESLEDSGGSSYYPPPHPAGAADWYGTVSSWRQHGYDTDSELVRQPSLGCYEPDGTATLHRPRGLVRPRPVAKVAARALLDTPAAELEAKAELLAEWADSDYGGPAKHVAPPPAPPKRTNSIRRQEADNMAEAAFATCVQSLTSRFTMATQEEPPLPPPPPPCEDVVQQLPGGSEDNSPIGTLVRRKDSGSSSVSSESLPFANENVGTIKQRPPGEGGPPGNPGSNPDGSPLGPSSPVKEKGPPAAVDCGSSPEDVPVRDVPQDYRSAAGKDKPTLLPRPTSQVLSSRHSDKLSVVSSSHGTSGHAPVLPSSSGDVIDDIEHMLASLTDQLDAMLECELNS